MESTSEVMWKEQTKSSVSKKVSATSVQKLTSSLVGEKSVLLVSGTDGDQINTVEGMAMMPSAAEGSFILSSPIITSPPFPEEGDAINTSNVQSEFSAMKLKDEHGNEVGEIVQQKQQQQSVKTSSLVTSEGSCSTSTSSVKQVSSSTSSSVLQQQSAASVVAESKESSSSMSCSSYSSTKKQEIVLSSTRSLCSTKSSQSIEKVINSSTAVVKDNEI